MPTIMSIGQETKHEPVSARQALLSPVLPEIRYSFGKIERIPAEMGDPAWSPHKGYGAYDLLYDATHGRVTAPEGEDDERDKDGEPVVALVAGRLFGPSVTDPLSDGEVSAINEIVAAQARSLANLIPMPESLARDETGIPGALEDIRLYYLGGASENGGHLPEDVVTWLDTYGSGRDGWDAFCSENYIPSGDCMQPANQEQVLAAWQMRADAMAERIAEKLVDERDSYVGAGRPEGEWEPFTALTELVARGGGWCRIELFDALAERLGTESATNMLMGAPDDFATMNGEYIELTEHGTDVDLSFDDAGNVTLADVNERIEKAKDADWRFDVEYVRGGWDGFWLWRLTGEQGDLQSVAEEYTGKGLYFPYNDNFDHAHSFEGVMQAILRDPEGFRVDGEQKRYYSEQELVMMDAFRDKLLARKGGEPDSSRFAWQVRKGEEEEGNK